jgi:hypothetical protein
VLAHNKRKTGEHKANKILFSIQPCTYYLRRDNIWKGLGDFWRLERGLTVRAIIGARVFDPERWMGPLLERREKWRTPSCFSARRFTSCEVYRAQMWATRLP